MQFFNEKDIKECGTAYNLLNAIPITTVSARTRITYFK